MKFIHKFLISASLICLVMVLASCNYQVVPVQPKPVPKPEVAQVCKGTPYSGDYEVIRLRAMWAVCAQSYAAKAPTAGPNWVAGICDCYVDNMRENYKQAELGKLTKPQAEAMGHQLMTACNVKIMDKLGRGEALKQNSTYQQNTIPKLL